jgi:hypothetical protein
MILMIQKATVTSGTLFNTHVARVSLLSTAHLLPNGLKPSPDKKSSCAAELSGGLESGSISSVPEILSVERSLELSFP